MPVIDITTMEGYSPEMTADEKLAMYEAYEIPEIQAPKVDMTGYIEKKQFDTLATELATLKREGKAKMSESEIKEAERNAEFEALKKSNAELMQEKTISERTADYLGMAGYDSALAKETAIALVSNEMETVFANQKIATSNYERSLKAELLAQGGKNPPAGNSPKQKKEQDMCYEELAEYYETNPQK